MADRPAPLGIPLALGGVVTQLQEAVGRDARGVLNLSLADELLKVRQGDTLNPQIPFFGRRGWCS